MCFQFSQPDSDCEYLLSKALTGVWLAGLFSRPIVRGMQRQNFSSRSSIASPLALSENGTKPLWPHSAKLQLRSNSPSRFSLESHSSSPTLERIGEVVDTVLATSCFAASPKSEKLLGAKTPLPSLNSSPANKRLIEHLHSKALAQAEQRSTAPPGDNNNVAAGAEQVSPRHAAAAKEVKPRHGSAESVKRSSAKTGLESERSPKKRPATSSTSSSSLSPASPANDKLPPRSQAKGAASASKDKSDGAPKSSKAGSSRTATPSKKGSCQTSEALHAEPVQQKKGGSPAFQSSQPQRRSSPRGAAERSSVSGRTRVAERSTSRDSRTNAAPERKAGGPPTKSSAAGRAEGRMGRASENRAVGRSSSSSSSMASLRSSNAAVASSANAAPPSRGPQRSSKAEEKGLSFFKTALRPKETHKTADGGKTGVEDAKASSEVVGGDTVKEGIPNGLAKKAQNVASEAKNNASNTAKDKESVRASSSAKHSTKSKISGAETTSQPPAKDLSKREPAKKAIQSRKIPINSTQASQKGKWISFKGLTESLVQLRVLCPT